MPIDAEARRPETAAFLDIDFSLLSMDEVLEEIRRRAGGKRFSYIVTPNVDHLVRLHPEVPDAHSAAFRDAYSGAALRLCDSRILHGLGRLSGVDLPVLTGSDLTARLFKGFFLPSDRIAIIGGEGDTIARLREHFPGPDYLQHIPPMGVLKNPGAQKNAIRFITLEKPDIVLFAIGAPQSEILASQCVEEVAGGVGLCIGASIEFLLGDKKRAPVWMQKLGLEWAFRLGSEPGRLWRRYLVDGPRIFRIALKHRKRGSG